jgi:predicted nucleic-acid-binding protein
MIGLDTNVLLRVFIDDDPAQTQAARGVVAGAERSGCFVSNLVLTELIWTLRSRYKTDRARIVDILRRLLDRAEFAIENRDTVREATRLFSRGRVDFADCLIAVHNRACGVSRTVSFDQEAIEMSLFEPVQT